MSLEKHHRFPLNCCWPTNLHLTPQADILGGACSNHCSGSPRFPLTIRQFQLGGGDASERQRSGFLHGCCGQSCVLVSRCHDAHFGYLDLAFFVAPSLVLDVFH